MHLFKISCQQCTQYSTCSPSTRMYVNYCGADRVRVKSRVEKAVQECREQRGFFLQHSLMRETRYVPLMSVRPTGT